MTYIPPIYETGRRTWSRRFEALMASRLAGDYEALTRVEAEARRQALRWLASESLTVLVEDPPRWESSGAGDSAIVFGFEVRHEAQTDDQLVRAVATALMNSMTLAGAGWPDPRAVARIAVEAVRDRGRLLPVPLDRPDGVPR